RTPPSVNVGADTGDVVFRQGEQDRDGEDAAAALVTRPASRAPRLAPLAPSIGGKGLGDRGQSPPAWPLAQRL
ncbi:MAG: hypothetical protein NTZ05_11620, partial [Chloroflexi bacterium]|nr:hypothetical protein [Chloroflexota bacterium]